MFMPQSDVLVERVYDTVNRQQDERGRLEVAQKPRCNRPRKTLV